MISLRLHPATRQLLGFQAGAKFRKLLRSFRGRRLPLSLLGVLLALIWIGQTILGILFRTPADPANLRSWIPLGLLTYALWHLVKTACRHPVEPFEWTPAEKELLGGAPLRRDEMLSYRLAAIFTSAALKAACFSLVMLVDIPLMLTGFVGVLLALLFIDLLRMALEIVSYGISHRSFVRFRVAVLAVVAACVISALVQTFCLPEPIRNGLQPASLSLVMAFLHSLGDLHHTWIGVAAELPFVPFARVILQPHWSWQLAGDLLLAGAMTMGMLLLVAWLDRRCLRLAVDRQRRQYSAQAAKSPHRGRAGTARTARQVPSVRVPLGAKGAGSIAWCQAMGSAPYRTSVLTALIVPAILSCIPLAAHLPRSTIMMHVIGSLVFYTFVLLPTALKFDFRRNIDRISVLKSLPISPAAVTVGQLAMPVTLSLLFQSAVLVVAMIAQPFPPILLLVALAVLLPVNVLTFSLENLVFLLYPYRLNQEGIDIFLRSILIFTAKGVLMTLAFIATGIWAISSRKLSEGSVFAQQPGILFAVGLWLMTTTTAIFVTGLLIRAYRRFDPSQDCPALS